MLVTSSVLIEKRKHPRIIVKLPATYHSSQTSIDSHITNISQGGLFLCSPNPDIVGTLAKIQLSLPTESALLKLEGKVAWSLGLPNQSGMGLLLVNLTRNQRLILANFLISRLYNS